MIRKVAQMNLESLGPGTVKECLLNINQHVLINTWGREHKV